MNNSKKIVLSVFIILWGVVLLIKHLNIIPYDLEEIFFNWKTFLIALGIFLLFYSKGKTFAAVLIVIGTWFWLDDVVGFSMFSFKIFLPTLLILRAVIC